MGLYGLFVLIESCNNCLTTPPPQGLLRAALDQEAELSKQIEGYSYSTKYNTQAFYYHAPSVGHSSRYSIRDPAAALDLAGPGHSSSSSSSGGGMLRAAHPAGMGIHTHVDATTLDATAAIKENAINAVIRAHQIHEIGRDPIYGGTDANLVRKLTLLDQEKRLFDLVDTSVIAEIKENFDEQLVNDPDIYIDPMVILTPTQPAFDSHTLQDNAIPSNTSCSETSSVGQEVVDLQRLNQTHYFGNTSSDTFANLAIDDASPAECANTTTLLAKKPLRRRNNAILNPILSRPLLVIIRHGKTEHNKLGLFTGWEDAALSPEGRKEARWAGKLLKKHGFKVHSFYFLQF